MATAFQRIADIASTPLLTRRTYPSPRNWADQVMYFLLLDRFSDGNEAGGKTQRYNAALDFENAVATDADAAAWREAGGTWAGGTLKGLQSKLGYLLRLGVTCLWVSPVFRQVHGSDSYHGYAIQNFLDIDPHFGTPEDLRALVEAAHAHGIYVVLDIILNHAGDVFAYDGPPGADLRYTGQTYPVKGFRDNAGGILGPLGPVDAAALGEHWSEVAVWPAELQAPETFTRKGYITSWDNYPEYVEGDFFSLKDIALGDGPLDYFTPSNALNTLCAVYQYWMAYADVDGYRLDTVKHMDPGAVRYFARSMHEFAQRIGKDNFYLIGEITGGRANAAYLLDTTGLDAALGIDDIPARLESLMKGTCPPEEYFSLFRNSLLVEKDLHKWFLDKVVTVLDDHDQVINGEHKARFCAFTPHAESLMLAALALNATTMGIPCVYYGSEQAFDGAGTSDRYVRECMFGGAFGAFRSRGRHFFNEEHPVYRGLAEVLRLRKERLPLRRGRQYLREISGNGVDFGFPRPWGGAPMRSLVAWSRILDREELVLAVNTDPENACSAWVRIDAALHQPGATFRYLYATDGSLRGLESRVEKNADGCLKLKVSAPPAGFVILEAVPA